jgi:CBS domain-containing protein
MLVEGVLPAVRERLVAIEEDAPVERAAELLSTAHVNLIVVCNSAGTIVGVVSKTDIARHISHCHGHACTISVSSVISRNVTSCAPSDWLHEL